MGKDNECLVRSKGVVFFKRLSLEDQDSRGKFNEKKTGRDSHPNCNPFWSFCAGCHVFGTNTAI
jgi:hypothetical protein